MNQINLDIRPDHLAIVRQILQRHIPHYEVLAFGSRVRGNAKPYSDLDLVVMTAKQPLTLAEHADLADAFSESDLPWKVDLADWCLIDDEFKEIIRQQYYVIQAGIFAQYSELK